MYISITFQQITGGGITLEEKKRKTKRRRKRSVGFSIALFVFVAIVMFNVITVHIDIAKKSEELEKAKAEYEALLAYNQELEAFLNSDDDEEYIIRMAREKLNLVFPDETVYCDIAQ